MMGLSWTVYTFKFMYCFHGTLECSNSDWHAFHLVIRNGCISFMAITVICFVLILIRINTQGTSQDLKKLVRNRHIMYFIFYMTFMTIPLLFIENNLLNLPQIFSGVAGFLCSGF